MSAIYYALIIFPILFMVAMGFIYSQSLTEINVQQIRINCPYPIMNFNITNTNIDVDTNMISYNQTFDSDPTILTIFRCGENGAPNVSTSVYTFTSNWFGTGEQAWFTAIQSNMAMWSSSITAFFDKIVALGIMLYLFINAPALVLTIPAFSYVNAVLIGFVALGGFMVIRG